MSQPESLPLSGAPVRILWLEDDPVDAALGMERLRRAGLPFEADVVSGRDEFEARLTACSYDIILADYRVPGWTGADALDLVRLRQIDLPLILVTGQLDDETAVECIKKGACDYVLKSRLARLPVAVTRALEEKATRHQRAQAERKARAMEQLVEHTLAGVLRSTPDGRLLDSNPALARMLGFSNPAELLAQDAASLYFDPATRQALVEQALRERFVTSELRLRRKDGSPVWMVGSITAVDDERGRPVLESTLIDITGRKKSEERILRLNRLYSVLSHLNQAMARIPEKIELLREVCRILVEDGGFRMVRYGEVDSQTGLVRPVMHCGAEESEGAALRVPIRVQDRPVGEFNLYAGVAEFFDEENVSLLDEVAADVSFALDSMEREAQRTRAEAERAELIVREQAARAQAVAEARFRRLLEAAPDAILEVDAHGTIVVLNPAAECLFGYRREELLGRSIELLVPEALRGAHQVMRAEYQVNPVHRAVRSAREVRVRHADGTEFPVEVSLSPVRTEEGDLVTCVVRDITYRKRAEEALRESHRRIASILESITDGFFALDREWQFTYLNHKAEQMLNRSRDTLLGRNLWDEFPDLVGSQFDAEYRKAAARQVPVEFTAHDPALKIWAEFHVYPSADGLSVFFQDVTARKHLEEQLRQSQKLEALGRLAGGVAHDFNNLLTIIGGYGQMLLEAAEPRNPARRDLEAIVEAATRASSLTRQLLAFSRRQIVQPKVFSLKSLVSRMNRMLRRVIGEDIELRLALGADVGRVKADPGQLEQVIMNLVVNARDAMPRGGRLTLETAEVELSAASHAEPRPELPPGTYVVLAIEDTGTGMDQQTRSRLFEPFFTTKPKGKGTGLGLSTAYGIVKQSGGDITVETEPGRGSTFRIWLPRAERPAPEARKPARTTVLRGSETVLLVEDEDEVRKLARSMLVRQGYKVIEAPDGPHALEVWEREGQGVDLLLTDVIMPRMSGRELAEKLTALRPDLKVLYMSGYTDDVIMQQGILEPRTRLLQKPFSREALGTLVRRTLDGPAARA